MVMADFAGRDVFLAQGQMAPWYFESARGKLNVAILLRLGAVFNPPEDGVPW